MRISAGLETRLLRRNDLMSEQPACTAPELTDVNPKEAKGQNPLGTEPVGKLLLTFSIPAILSMLMNSVYNIIDQIFIGRGVGFLGNAATTVTFPIVTLFFAFASMISAGGAAFVSIKLGQRKEEVAERALTNVYALSALSGLTLMTFGLVFLKPLLRLFGATETVMPYALQYASIVLLGVLLNTILNPIYIFIFHWGVRGSAIANVTSQLLTTVIGTVYFLKYGKHMRLRLRHFRIDLGIWRQVLALGFSSVISQGAMCVTQTVMNNSLVYYGNLNPLVGSDVALSAMGIVNKIMMTIFAFGMGISFGSQPILGYNRGAKQPERMRKCYFLAVAFATACISVGWLVCHLFPSQLLGIFGSGGAGFLDFAVSCLFIYTFGSFLSGFQVVSSQYFQATGQPVKAALLASLRQLSLLVPLLLILPPFFGLKGILYAGPAADFASAVIVFFFIRKEMKKIGRWIKEGNMPEPAVRIAQADRNT
jgi:Na+-driven multidrug efflux pump